MSQQPLQADMKSWLAHWRRVGPILERIRREELRNFDYWANRKQVAGLFEIGVRHGPPRTTSGLVELQRRLRKLRT